MLGTIVANRYGELVAGAYHSLLESILEFSLHGSLIDAAEEILADSQFWLTSIVFLYLGLYFFASAIVFISKVIFGRTGAIIGTIFVAIVAASMTIGAGALAAIAGFFGAIADGQVILALINILLSTATGLAIGATAGAVMDAANAKVESTDTPKSEPVPTGNSEPTIQGIRSESVRETLPKEDVKAQIEARRKRLLGDDD